MIQLGFSGGEPHFLEDLAQRVSNAGSVFDYFQALEFIDPDKIVIVGIYAGGLRCRSRKGGLPPQRRRRHRHGQRLELGASWMVPYGDGDPSKHVATLNSAVQQIKPEVVKGAERAAAAYVRPRR